MEVSVSIIVHGGAGDLVAGDDATSATAGCWEAARAGHAILRRGGSALDAVVEAVRVLEDDPRFNAGLGSALTADGSVETDASVMVGEGGAGAVAALCDVKNPIVLARLVMERTPHVLLAGDGARAFAREQGIALLAPNALVTERARAKWRRSTGAADGGPPAPAGSGTVGACARDGQGRVAAATSTGGTPGKRHGRVGDTAVIGAGTYADARAGAVSCTGLGEAIMKSTLAATLVRALERDRATSIAALAGPLVTALERFGGQGGLIAVAADGRIGHAFGTQRMARAWIDTDGNASVGFAPGDDQPPPAPPPSVR